MAKSATHWFAVVAFSVGIPSAQAIGLGDAAEMLAAGTRDPAQPAAYTVQTGDTGTLSPTEQGRGDGVSGALHGEAHRTVMRQPASRPATPPKTRMVSADIYAVPDRNGAAPGRAQAIVETAEALQKRVDELKERIGALDEHIAAREQRERAAVQSSRANEPNNAPGSLAAAGVTAIAPVEGALQAKHRGSGLNPITEVHSAEPGGTAAAGHSTGMLWAVSVLGYLAGLGFAFGMLGGRLERIKARWAQWRNSGHHGDNAAHAAKPGRPIATALTQVAARSSVARERVSPSTDSTVSSLDFSLPGDSSRRTA